MKLRITIDLDNGSFVDRTKEELEDILAQITQGDVWDNIACGDYVRLKDSWGEYVAEVEVYELDPRLKGFLIRAVKHGGYDPHALGYVEEEMNLAEYDEARAFLLYVQNNKLTFGSGTIDKRWATWKASIRNDN